MTDSQKSKQFNTTGIVNKNEIFPAAQEVTTGGNLGNRLPTKQKKEKVVHPNMSINITEEALKRGKLPIEIVARNVV